MGYLADRLLGPVELLGEVEVVEDAACRQVEQADLEALSAPPGAQEVETASRQPRREVGDEGEAVLGTCCRFVRTERTRAR